LDGGKVKKKDSPESYRGQKGGMATKQLKRVGKNLMAASKKKRERNEENGKNYVLVSISF
jgi:hypothetical protein